MAKTGSISITVNSQSVAECYSNVTIKGIITTTGESYRGSHRTGTYEILQDNILIRDGLFTSGAPENSTTTLFETTIDIYHYENGDSGDITVNYNYDDGWCTASTSTTLTAITRTFTNIISHWLYPLIHGEGNNPNKDSFQLASDTSFEQEYNTTFTLDSNKATTIPNGCYLASIDSNSISGTWTHYIVGTEFTQQAKSLGFQYTYSPATYSITYDLDGGTNNTSNPSSYNILYGVSLKVPTKPYYMFNGWEIKTEAKTLNLYADLNENYRFVRILSNIQPGVQYTISLTGKLNSGTATGFRIVTYDFTSNEALWVSVTNPFDSDIVTTYTCPSTADASHDIAIIIYAGVNGSTAGNNVTYNDVVVTYNATGINEGDNATFSSASDLYMKLDARMTGNVTAKAIWYPNKYTITFYGNGGTTIVDSLEVAYKTTQNNDIGQYIPQRQAYEFLGWYSSPTGGVQVYDANGLCTNDGTYWLNDVCVHTEDYTLYAQWKTLNIAYCKHDGEWKLCRTYIKVNNTWSPAIMYIKSNNKYIR